MGEITEANYWDKHPDEIIEFWEKGEAKVTRDRFRLISRWLSGIGDYESLLDIGCGNGNLIRYCSISDSKYLGVDSSKEMLKRLTENYPKHRVIAAKFLECDLSQSDIVVAHGFLEHQPDFWESISKLANLARKSLTLNVLTSDQGKLEFKSHGCWQRILDPEEFGKLKDVLSKDFSVSELKFYARAEKYVFCTRRV